MEQVHTVKNIEEITKNIALILLTRHFLRNTKLRLPPPYENAPSELKKSYSKLPNSKDILDRLDELSKKIIPLCKSIISQILLWASFIKYERTMVFTWARR